MRNNHNDKEKHLVLNTADFSSLLWAATMIPEQERRIKRAKMDRIAHVRVTIAHVWVMIARVWVIIALNQWPVGMMFRHLRAA